MKKRKNLLFMLPHLLLAASLLTLVTSELIIIQITAAAVAGVAVAWICIQNTPDWFIEYLKEEENKNK